MRSCAGFASIYRNFTGDYRWLQVNFSVSIVVSQRITFPSQTRAIMLDQATETFHSQEPESTQAFARDANRARISFHKFGSG